MSGVGGDHPDSHDNGNGRPVSDELSAFIDKTVTNAIERVDEADPLGKGKQGSFPKLLIGTQVSYDPARWSPDPRARAPIGSPERDAWEADPNPVSQLDEEVRQVYYFLDGIDADTGFTDD